MKKLPFAIVALLVLTALFACGPNMAERAEIQKRHDDSIKNVMSNRYASQSDIKEALYKLKDLQQKLEQEKSNLKAENDKMAEIQAADPGKSHLKQEQQIKDEQLVIQSVKNNIAALNQKINQAQDRITAIKMQTQKYR